jgi:tetratricopeptide (TPR) repeat protein
MARLLLETLLAMGRLDAFEDCTDIRRNVSFRLTAHPKESHMRLLAIACSTFLLSACAGVGIVVTSDPLEKLNDAEDLFVRQHRPLPAERLIREAMSIYQERDDAHGMGHANREYADLLTSPAIAKWEYVYRRDGFQDKSITFDNRFQKASEFYRNAIQYYEKAQKQHAQSGKYDKLTNLYFNLAWTHYRVDELDKACSYYDQAAKAYNENVRLNPTAQPYLPRGSGSFEEFIGGQKRRVGCSA